MNKFIKDMSNEDYHANEAIGSSTLKAMLSSPALARYRLDNPSEPTDAMILGSAIHTAFLEPEKFEEEYEITENKKGEPFLIGPEGKITPAKFEIFDAMRNALANSKEAQDIINDALIIEGSFFTELDGIKIKCRTDILTKSGYIVDLKTVGGMKNNPSSPENFQYDFFDRGYDLQMFMYKKIIEAVTGKKFKGFKFLCVDAKKPISGVNVYTFTEGESKWFEIGGHRFHEAFELYKQCLKTGDWFAYEQVEHDDLELSYKAAEYYASICEGEE